MPDVNDMKTLRQWCAEYGEKYDTVRKRHAMVRNGMLLGSGTGTWYLTHREFQVVLRTPLPGCVRVP